MDTQNNFNRSKSITFLRLFPKLSFITLILGAILLVLNTIYITWLSSRWCIWADEWDSLSLVFLPWKSKIAHDFWWQLGQFNANPPGDNLMLRLYFHLTEGTWLHTLSPELFWRIPYIFIYSMTLLLSPILAFTWTRSYLLSFLTLVFFITSNALFVFAGEVRFYIPAVFFTSITLFLFMLWLESNYDLKYLLPLSFFTAWGVCHHLLLASIGYLLLFVQLIRIAFRVFVLCSSFELEVDSSKKGHSILRKIKIWQYKNISIKIFKEICFLLLAALPFIVYKVALKHWVFIAPAKTYQDLGGVFNFFVKFLHMPLTQYLYWVKDVLPFSNFWSAFYLAMIPVGLVLSGIYLIKRRDFNRALQAMVLLSMIVVAPAVIHLSAVTRNYALTLRHFLFLVPVVCCSLIFFSQFIKIFSRSFLEWIVGLLDNLKLQQDLTTVLRSFQVMLGFVLFLLSFCFSIDVIQSRAKDLRDASPSKVNYPIVQFREFYKYLPDKGQLVIVGLAPDRYFNSSDQGQFTAGIFSNAIYTFKPAFLSKHGSYNILEKKDNLIAKSIQSRPENYDYLILDSIKESRKQFSFLPWNRFQCSSFDTSKKLTFCRIPRSRRSFQE